jgi:hypothetical protein
MYKYMSRLSSQVIEALVENIPPVYTVGPTYDEIKFPQGYEKPTREDFDAKHRELLGVHQWKELREERNKRIAQTDYLFTSDYPHATEEVKQAWLDYRQALRDLPANTTDPENPVWPLAPQ